MSSLNLNDVLGKILGQTSGQAQAPAIPDEHHGMLDSILGMANAHGGLGGLLDNLKQNGLGNAVQSWIGTGSNVPVDGQQVTAALGSQKIQEIAKKLGLSPDQAAGGLAGILPQLVDKLSPGGKLPDSAALGQMLGSIKSALAAKAAPSA